jgi:hypothetical protein
LASEATALLELSVPARDQLRNNHPYSGLASGLTLNDNALKACLYDNVISQGEATMKSIRLNAFIFATASIVMLLLAVESGAAEERALACKGTGHEGAAKVCLWGNQ